MYWCCIAYILLEGNWFVSFVNYFVLPTTNKDDIIIIIIIVIKNCINWINLS